MKSLSLTLITGAILGAAALLAPLHAEEPKPKEKDLLKNGDFEKGPAHWRGDRKIQAEEGSENKIAVVEANSRMQRFQQDIDTRNMTDVVLKFRIKGDADYEGRGIQLRFEPRSGSYTFRDVPVKAGAWQDVEWKFGNIKGAPSMTFAVEVNEGKGKVMFDDFSIVEK